MFSQRRYATCQRLAVRLGRATLLLAVCVGVVAPLTSAQRAAGETTPATERRFTRQIAPGIRHVQIIREPPAPLVANLLFLDPAQAGWRLQVWPAKDVIMTPDSSRGREAVGDLAARRGAVAALNGDFFPFTGDPLGLQITDGELYSEPHPGRSAFGITREGRTLWGPVRFTASVRAADRSFPIHGINRSRKSDELILYTPRYGADTGTRGTGIEVVVEWLEQDLRPGVAVRGTVSQVAEAQGATPIPAEGLVLSGHGTAAAFLKGIGLGDAVMIRMDLVGEEGQNWNEAWQAIGGGPRLLKKGEVALTPEGEGFGKDVLKGRAPRSAIGITRSGEWVLAAVDGRQWISAGMTLPELATWLRDEGVVDAINLDGGGSTTLFLRQVVVNSPSDGRQRPVANALLVLPDPALAPPSGDAEVALAWEAPSGPVLLAANPAQGTKAAEEANHRGASSKEGTDPLTLTAGARLHFRAIWRLPDGTWQEAPEEATTWGVEGMLGRLEQDGTFLGTRAGMGAVLCSIYGKVARVPVSVTPGAPKGLTATFETSANGTAAVRARVVDAYGNGVPGVALTVRYTTKEGPKTGVLSSDATGTVRWPIPLSFLVPDKPVVVSAPNVPSSVLKCPPLPAEGKTPSGAQGAPLQKGS